MRIAGSKKKKLLAKARAFEPAMGNGSDGPITPAGHNCEVWVSREKAATSSISATALVAEIKSLVG
jgi:hypothetical protein